MVWIDAAQMSIPATVGRFMRFGWCRAASYCAHDAMSLPFAVDWFAIPVSVAVSAKWPYEAFVSRELGMFCDPCRNCPARGSSSVRASEPEEPGIMAITIPASLHSFPASGNGTDQCVIHVWNIPKLYYTVKDQDEWAARF